MAEGELLLSVAAGEEPEVADAVEVAGQDMEQEASDELLGGKGHGLEAVVMAVVAPAEADLSVVAPAEADLSVVDGEEAVVGDGDAVGVAAEVVEDLLGTGEGPLGVDDPLGPAEGLEGAGKGGGVVEGGEGVAELESAGEEGLLEEFKEEAAEQAGEDANGEEEAGAAANPAVACRSNAAAGDDAVQVGVKLKPLAPGMQDGEEADLSPEVLGIGSEGAQGAGGGAKQQGVDDPWVLQGEGGDGLGEGKDEVEVGAVEQFGATLADPLGAGKGLALGAVAVAAGAIAEAAVAAVVALLDLAAEGGGAAAFDGGHDAALGGGQRGGETAAESVPVTVEDVSHLKIGAGHRVDSADCGRSSGLVVVETLKAARCRVRAVVERLR